MSVIGKIYPSKTNGMSKTAAITIRSSVIVIDEKIFRGILNSLLASGWGTDIDNQILYMQNATYDFEVASSNRLDYVLSLISNSVSNKKACFLRLVWNNSIGLEVTYLSPNSIMLSLSEDVAMLTNMKIPDFSFYLNRISKIFDVIDINRIECIYD